MMGGTSVGDSGDAIRRNPVAAQASSRSSAPQRHTWEKYLTTSVSQWMGTTCAGSCTSTFSAVARRTQRHAQGRPDHAMKSDISAIQDFINSVSILVNVLTLAGTIGVMFYINGASSSVALRSRGLSWCALLHRRISRVARRQERKERCLRARRRADSIHVVQAFARKDYEDRGCVGKRISSKSGCRPRHRRRSCHRSSKSSSRSHVLVLATAGAPLAGRISPGVLIVFLLYLGQNVQADARFFEDDRHQSPSGGR